MRKYILTFVLILAVGVAYADTRRVWYYPDKSVKVRSCSPSVTWDYCIEEALGADPTLIGLPYDDMDSSMLPDRADRNAWEGDPWNGLGVNQTKALKGQQDKLIIGRAVKIKKDKGRKDAIKELIDEGLLPGNYTE